MNDPVNVHVGLRLRGLRLAAGATQRDVAKMLGVTFQQVQKLERGKNQLVSSQLGKLAAGLGVPVSAFFEGLEGSRRTDSSTAMMAGTEAGRLIHFYRTIESPDLRKAVLSLAKEVARRSGRAPQPGKSAR